MKKKEIHFFYKSLENILFKNELVRWEYGLCFTGQV
jgi:hypothetical protein